MRETQIEYQVRRAAGHTPKVSAYYARKSGRVALNQAAIEQRAEKWILRPMSESWINGLASHLAGKQLDGWNARWFLFGRTVNGQRFTPSGRDYIQQADTQSNNWVFGRCTHNWNLPKGNGD